MNIITFAQFINIIFNNEYFKIEWFVTNDYEYTADESIVFFSTHSSVKFNAKQNETMEVQEDKIIAISTSNQKYEIRILKPAVISSLTIEQTQV